MTTAQVQTDRAPYSRDLDGSLRRYVRDDEVFNESIDFVRVLDSGETLASVTVETDGPTVSNVALSNGRDGTQTQVGFTVTGSGWATIRAVTSDSRTLERRMRWISSDGFSSGRYR